MRWRRLLELDSLCLLFAFAVIWLRPGPLVLYGVDAACYARIASEIMQRPISEWYVITWYGEPFFEHPPLALLVESVWFRLFGATPTSAVFLARIYASLVVVLTFAVAKALANRETAAMCVAVLPLFSGFIHESQNPMLELPLTVFLGLAVLGIVWADSASSPRQPTVLFAVGFSCAALIKGPPALAVLPVLMWAILSRRIRFRHAAFMLAAGVGTMSLAIAVYELRRYTGGYSSFFVPYLEHQVLASVFEGRHHPAPASYMMNAVWRWYKPAVLLLPLGAIAYTFGKPQRALLEVGFVFAVTIVVGFSLPTQKYHWYIHPIMLGCAWVVGASLGAFLARLPVTVLRWAPCLVALFLVAQVTLVHIRTTPADARKTEIIRIHTLDPPEFFEGEARRVAHCGKLGPWDSKHAYGFLWNAESVECNQSAPFRFDGKGLHRQ